MESIAQEADRHSRRAFDLASRKAYFAARSEFILALRLLAEGLDSENRTNVHGRALAAALTALREAEDFLPNPERMTAEVNVATIVRGHLTPVMKNAESDRVSSLEAVKCYLTFAQEQMGRAVGQEVAGSMALHGLGKLHAAQAAEQDCRIKACESKAVVFFQAALLVFPRNYLASNDLGVLLARCGYFGEARMALEHSLSIYHQSTGWGNLALVYRYLGEANLARRAESLKLAAQQAEEQARRGVTPPADQLVQWMDPYSFAQSFAQTPSAREPLPVRNASPVVSTTPTTPQPMERRTLGMKQPATAALPLPTRAY